MSPNTWKSLGFPALRPDQAKRTEDQGRALAGGNYMRWPTPDELLPDYVVQQWTPPQSLQGLDVVEIPPESATLHWNLAIADAKRDERKDADCMDAFERREWVRL